MTNITPGVVTDIGAVADAVAETSKTIGKGIDAAEAAKDRQAGADAATVKGQTDALKEIDLAKRAEVAGQAAAGSPDAEWADGVREQFVRPD